MSSSPSFAPPAGPLVGLKVVDFCSFIAGTYSAMLMGEFGASVVKVEPLEGDPARTWGPFLNGEGKLFQGWNQNKRGMAVDLRSEAGREIAHRLCKDADVVIENFRPGVTEKLSIDYATIRSLNPRVIYCSSTAFGPRGPYKLRPGYDPILQSLSGAAMANIRFNGVVGICSVPVMDFNTAMLGFSGVLAALYVRERTGEGQKIETSLLQGAMGCQTHMFCQALETSEDGPTGIYPYQLYKTKDGHLFIAGPTNKFWRMICEAIGAGDLAENPLYQNNRDRCLHADELTARLQAYTQTRPTAEIEKMFMEKGIPCGAVKTFSDFIVDPQVVTMGMNPVIRHSSIGPMRVAGVPIDFEKTPGAIQSASPRLGEHTEEILRELGYDGAQIAQLKNQNVISAPEE